MLSAVLTHINYAAVTGMAWTRVVLQTQKHEALAFPISAACSSAVESSNIHLMLHPDCSLFSCSLLIEAMGTNLKVPNHCPLPQHAAPCYLHS